MQQHGDFMSVSSFPDHRINLGAVRALEVFKHHDSHGGSGRRLEQRGVSGERAGGKREQADHHNDIEE